AAPLLAHQAAALLLTNPIHVSIIGQHVNLPRGILPERQHLAESGDVPHGTGGDAAVLVGDAAQPALTVIREEVLPVERTRRTAARHEAPDNRAAVRMVVLERRRHQPGRVATPFPVAVRPLHYVPTVVHPAPTRRADVQLFPQVLPDVRDKEESRRAVE